MPTLPGLPLSQSHFDRVVAAFPGATMEEKTQAYHDWLINKLIDEVESVELSRLRHEFATRSAEAHEALSNSLPPRRPWPPVRYAAPTSLTNNRRDT